MQSEFKFSEVINVFIFCKQHQRARFSEDSKGKVILSTIPHWPIQYGNTLKNWHYKKKQNTQLQTLLSQKLRQIQSKNWNFQKVNSISSKQCCFLHALSTWVHIRGSAPYSPGCRCQRLEVLKELTSVDDIYVFTYHLSQVYCRVKYTGTSAKAKDIVKTISYIFIVSLDKKMYFHINYIGKIANISIVIV